jgi:hypothetical protein
LQRASRAESCSPSDGVVGLILSFINRGAVIKFFAAAMFLF